MALPVITVASGGLAVVEVTAFGMPVTEAPAGCGIAVTKVTGGKPGLGVTYVSATGGPVLVPGTWNPNDKSNVTLSNGNLTATISPTTGGVRATAGKSSGKFYLEYTMTTWGNGGSGPGISLASANFTQNFTFLNGGAGMTRTSGTVSVDTVFKVNFGTRATGDIIGAAVDLNAKLIWFRVAPSGLWNNSAPANPATGTGGFDITPIATGLLFPHYFGGVATEACTANFGASAFSGTVPSGFTAGWPA